MRGFGSLLRAQDSSDCPYESLNAITALRRREMVLPFSHKSKEESLWSKALGDTDATCSLLREVCSSPGSKLAHLPSSSHMAFAEVLKIGLNSKGNVTGRDNGCLCTGQRWSWWDKAKISKWVFVFLEEARGKKKDPNSGMLPPFPERAWVFGVCLGQIRAPGYGEAKSTFFLKSEEHMPLPGNWGTFKTQKGSLLRIADVLCQNVFPLFVKNQSPALRHPFLMTLQRVRGLLVQLCLPLCWAGQDVYAPWVGEGTTAVTCMIVASVSKPY